MMRKILVILTMLVLLISCGKKGSKDDPFKNLGNNKGGNSSNQVSEIEKYNLYIGVHNELLSFENSARDYFEDAGAEEQFKKPSGSVLANFHQIPQIIEKIKKVLRHARAEKQLECRLQKIGAYRRRRHR